MVGEQGLASSLNLTRFVGEAGELGGHPGRLVGWRLSRLAGWLGGGLIGGVLRRLTGWLGSWLRGGVAVWPIGWIHGGRGGWSVPVTNDTGTLGCGPASGMAAGAAG